MRHAARRSAAGLKPESASTLRETSQVEPPDESQFVAGWFEGRAATGQSGDPGGSRSTSTRAAVSARVYGSR